MSRIDIQFDPGKRRFKGTTENVATLRLDLASVPRGEKVVVELDKQKIENIDWAETLWLQNEGGS